MAYSDFTLDSAVKGLKLTIRPRADLLAGIVATPVPPVLRSVLDRFAPLALEVGTEKALSEFIIAPILAEAADLAGQDLGVYSGVTFDVDRVRGLVGRCDFLIGKKTQPFLLGFPIIAVVEAKNGNIADNLGQCVAELVAVQLYNESRDQPLLAIHGAVTIGSSWLFCRLDGDAVTFDIRERSLDDVGMILGHLVAIGAGAA